MFKFLKRFCFFWTHSKFFMKTESYERETLYNSVQVQGAKTEDWTLIEVWTTILLKRTEDNSI